MPIATAAIFPAFFAPEPESVRFAWRCRRERYEVSGPSSSEARVLLPETKMSVESMSDEENE